MNPLDPSQGNGDSYQRNQKDLQCHYLYKSSINSVANPTSKFQFSNLPASFSSTPLHFHDHHGPHDSIIDSRFCNTNDHVHHRINDIENDNLSITDMDIDGEDYKYQVEQLNSGFFHRSQSPITNISTTFLIPHQSSPNPPISHPLSVPSIYPTESSNSIFSSTTTLFSAPFQNQKEKLMEQNVSLLNNITESPYESKLTTTTSSSIFDDYYHTNSYDSALEGLCQEDKTNLSDENCSLYDENDSFGGLQEEADHKEHDHDEQICENTSNVPWSNELSLGYEGKWS